jgi:hypothetical protein
LDTGLQRIDSWTRAVRGCGGVDNPLTLAPNYLEILDAMDAGVEEWQVVNLLKVPQTARRICRACELPPLRVCQILWTLKLLGAVATPDLEDEPAAEPVGPDRPVEVEAELLALPARIHGGDEPEPARVEPELEPEPASPELLRAILRFNAMHRVLYRALRTEIGAGAVNFVRSCCATAGTEDVLEGVELHPDGTWDEPSLARAARERQIEDPWPAYRRLLDREYLQLKPHLGDERALELKQRIWEVHGASAGSEPVATS